MKVVTDNKHYNNIAAAIREKTATENTYTPADMASGVNEVYEAGKKAEQKAFWALLLDNGNRRDYYYAFNGEYWGSENFKPQYNIVPTEADHTFYRHNKNGTPYDLAQHLEELGVVIDMSNCTLGNYTFESANVTRLPVIDNRKGTFTCFIRNCNKLKTVDGIICNDAGDQNFTQTFNACSVLENITFTGVIGRSINFSNSPLSVASVTNILTHLKNYADTANAGTYTVTLSDKSKNAMAAAGTLEELDGKTYDAYIADKGWNLA